jgi:hypothetical protein
VFFDRIRPFRGCLDDLGGRARKTLRFLQALESGWRNAIQPLYPRVARRLKPEGFRIDRSARVPCLVVKAELLVTKKNG